MTRHDLPEFSELTNLDGENRLVEFVDGWRIVGNGKSLKIENREEGVDLIDLAAKIRQAWPKKDGDPERTGPEAIAAILDEVARSIIPGDAAEFFGPEESR